MTNTDELRAQLWGSFLLFIETFFPLVTGREFRISHPSSRESHFITISRELTKVARMEQKDLLINVPPGYGKSVMVSMWVAWTLSQYPDSQYLYIAYGKTLAAKHTEFIRRILQNTQYQRLFNISLKQDSRAKDYFQTQQGGSIKAFGAAGAITGCFDYDALVLTDNGYCPIGEVVYKKLKCRVLSFNEDAGEYEYRAIKNWFRNPPNHIVEVKFSDGSSIECTPDHKILTSNRGWVEARHLCSRKAVKSIGSRNIFPVGIKYIRHVNQTYCLEVEGNHNFIIKAGEGAITVSNCDAGLPNLDRFSGAVIIDDPHKPDEVHSDTIRQSVIQNYKETILQRPRSPNVPIIFIGQRLHEDDLAAHMLSGKDERKYTPLILQALDGADNPLYPEVNTKEALIEKREKSSYVFASQYQQDPIPSGGALYKRTDFAILEEEPKMLCTFITCDTAETANTVNDASAFGFFGLYWLDEKNQRLALHWINAKEMHVEPRDLEHEFLSFYNDCQLHPTPPQFAAIEKKSTGVTLLSVLEQVRGLALREVKRTKASGSKTTRFLEMQPLIGAKLVSFTDQMFHVEHCINHMMKITANDTHRHDDLADTLYDAIKIGLIDKALYIPPQASTSSGVVRHMADNFRRRQQAFNPTHRR